MLYNIRVSVSIFKKNWGLLQ